MIYFAVLYVMRKNSSGRIKPTDLGPNFDHKNDGDHNQFSQVGSGPSDVLVKPVDFTGNIFEHNYETMNEDLKNIGIKKEET